jgi:cyclic pyranopterin phosphate synthase
VQFHNLRTREFLVADVNHIRRKAAGSRLPLKALSGLSSKETIWHGDPMSKLTHLDEHGQARMVDVGGKAETAREAVATGRIRMSAQALAAIREGDAPKGDVLAAARIAAIMAAKKTGDLIPLCHPLALDAVTVDFSFEGDAVRASATASLTGKTGVEMEAMVAVSVALLTIYDMAKALDKSMVIEGVRLIAKRGGKSGEWLAPE